LAGQPCCATWGHPGGLHCVCVYTSQCSAVAQLAQLASGQLPLNACCIVGNWVPPAATCSARQRGCQCVVLFAHDSICSGVLWVVIQRAHLAAPWLGQTLPRVVRWLQGSCTALPVTDRLQAVIMYSWGTCGSLRVPGSIHWAGSVGVTVRHGACTAWHRAISALQYPQGRALVD